MSSKGELSDGKGGGTMPKIRFAVECPGAKTVHLAGDFNQWQGRRMRRARKGEDVFAVVLALKPGRYEFKYVVDGEWVCCPHAARVANALGTENSVIEVCP